MSSQLDKLDYNPTIFISGRHPSKKNSQEIRTKFVGRKRVRFIGPSDRYLAWEKGAILEAKLKWAHPKIKVCKTIRYDFIFADNRKKDSGNACEGIQDIFQKKGVDVLVDDSWQLTGYVTHGGRLAKKGEECGCHITFEVLEYE
jgi:hypothetical protein